MDNDRQTKDCTSQSKRACFAHRHSRIGIRWQSKDSLILYFGKVRLKKCDVFLTFTSQF